MPRAAAELVSVLESFIGHDGKEERTFRIGDLVAANDPAVKKWPHLFGPIEHINRGIEQATAAPGEKRGA